MQYFSDKTKTYYKINTSPDLIFLMMIIFLFFMVCKKGKLVFSNYQFFSLFNAAKILVVSHICGGKTRQSKEGVMKTIKSLHLELHLLRTDLYIMYIISNLLIKSMINRSKNLRKQNFRPKFSIFDISTSLWLPF